MGIISRFADIMKANINDLLDKCEDPAKMVEQMLRDLNKNLADVRKETANVMAEEKRCKRILEEKQAEVDKWTGYAKKAIEAGNDGDAKTFISKKQKSETNLADAQNMYNLAKDNADKMRAMHDKLQNDIQELEARKEGIKAKTQVAKTQKKINKVTAGTDVSSSLAAFDRMEQRVNQELDAAMAESELSMAPADTAAELANKYDNGESDASVDAELAAMKAELGL